MRLTEATSVVKQPPNRGLSNLDAVKRSTVLPLSDVGVDPDGHYPEIITTTQRLNDSTTAM